MLVARHHMQVSVCTFGLDSKRPGLPSFRKNIISFPQEINELKDIILFRSNLSKGDVVTVVAGLGGEETREHRCRIVNIANGDVEIELSDSERTLATVSIDDIHRRIKLPWKPQDLRDNLILLRRENATKASFIEDLCVRRDIVRRLMKLLTTIRNWRADRGEEPLHSFYTGIDAMDDAEVVEHFPWMMCLKP